MTIRITKTIGSVVVEVSNTTVKKTLTDYFAVIESLDSGEPPKSKPKKETPKKETPKLEPRDISDLKKASADLMAVKPEAVQPILEQFGLKADPQAAKDPAKVSDDQYWAYDLGAMAMAKAKTKKIERFCSKNKVQKNEHENQNSRNQRR